MGEDSQERNFLSGNISISGSELAADMLSQGIPIKSDEVDHPDGWIPPEQEKRGNLILSFMGLLFADPLVSAVLRKSVDLYPHKVLSGDDAMVSHMLSWDFWERHPEKWHSGLPAENPISDFGLIPVDGVKIYSIPPEYREAILHFCAGERLGAIYPRLIHAGIITYLLTTDEPKGPVMESFIVPNTVNLEEGNPHGYFQRYEIQLKTPEGMITVGSLDDSKREVLKRISDHELRSTVETEWEELQKKRKRTVGYRRRRSISNSSIEHVAWLFRRHVLQESVSDIARAENTSFSTVESAIKRLRFALDLQLKGAVKCLQHKVRPGRLHSS